VALHNARVEGDRKRLEDAQAVVKLAAMETLAYERARVEAAKKLGIRVTFLDRLVGEIRQRRGGFRIRHMVDEDRAGATIHFTFANKASEGKTIEGVVISSGTSIVVQWDVKANRYCDKPSGEMHYLILLADGNCTIIDGASAE
jgi:hypothetical protein